MLRQPGFVALFCEPCSEVFSRFEWVSIRVDDECKIACFCDVDRVLQFRPYREVDCHAGFLGFESYNTVADMLPPDADHVATSQPGEQQQIEREPRPRPDRMKEPELVNLLHRPAMKSVCLRVDRVHSVARIGFNVPGRYSPIEKLTDGLQRIVSRKRLVRLCIHCRLHMLSSDRVERLFTGIVNKAFQDAIADALR